MFATLVLSAVALADVPIDAGELLGNAYTLPAKRLRLQILAPSSYGVTDELEIKSSLLDLLGGPNAQVEYGLMRDGDRALSLNASVTALWVGEYIGGSVGGLYTLGGAEENRLSFGADVGFAVTSGTGAVSLPLSANYELVTSPQKLWSFFASTDAISLSSGSTLGTGAGASWTRGWEVYRLTLGAILTDTTEVNASLVDSGFEPLGSSFLPLPYLLMWWTI
ncbi:MAG: hypothetical protein ACI8RZ_006220 [Myxococcota bacterium]|jgi:hypothetical protein